MILFFVCCQGEGSTYRADGLDLDMVLVLKLEETCKELNKQGSFIASETLVKVRYSSSEFCRRDNLAISSHQLCP